MDTSLKVLVITYYWPPCSGSGVQRWMYFCKYLKEFGVTPIVITVDEKKASYRNIDESFNELVKDIEVYRTNTMEPLKIYSRIMSGKENAAIPTGFAGEAQPNIFQKLSRFVRGNIFIPDARKGWVRYAVKKAEEVIKKENISFIITNGPPHSTHFIGLELKKKFSLTWMADFRDPWTALHYNKFLYRTKYAIRKDAALEYKILNESDVILTVGPTMKQHLIKKGNISPEKITFIYNGYEESDFVNVAPVIDKEKFTICHIGMLSDSQPITAFLLALSRFYEKNHSICKTLKLVFAGNVSKKTVEEIGNITPWIHFENLGYVTKKKAIQLMLSSDLLFNSLPEMEDSELMISGKLMEYIAAGKPILCLGNPQSDAAFLINNFENCQVIKRSDVDIIYSYLSNLFNHWMSNKNTIPENRNIKQYSRYESTRKLADLIKDIEKNVTK